jgi:hypothetical protein
MLVIDWARVSAKVLGSARRRKMFIVISLVVSALAQFVLEFYRHELMDLILPHFGKLGRLFLTYPFGALAVVITGVATWLIYIAVDAAVEQVESPVLGPGKEKLYRQRIDSKFLAGFVLATLLTTVIFAYGVVRHYRDPFPNVVSLSHAFFEEQYRRNDLYIAVILKNYSDVPVPVKIKGKLSIFGESIAPTEEGAPSTVTMPPWEEHTLHWQLGFKPGASPSVAWALNHDGIVVGVDALYNNGKRDVEYQWSGRLLGSHYVPNLEGQIDVLQDDTN